MPPHHDYNNQTPAVVPPPLKANPKVLSLLLKAIIMILLTSLFFLFLGLASAALLLLHLSLSSHRQSHRRSSLPSTTPSSGLPPKDLNALPHFRLKKDVRKYGALEGDECVVCLDAFRDGQCCRQLAACGHVFHKRCVDSWLLKVAACPICRARVRLNAATKGLMLGVEDEDKQSWGVW
ncbi:RING-H2 finger protein ATL56-like [Corylus avellana]|uniref:RING-H2 finger protein ATL56-like n=1 Tax=Corylus avellana TaxID=13451 RepID=UPI00286CB41A|nr:RING-H2 finger protein ATL56-like [Corylus avellana]